MDPRPFNLTRQADDFFIRWVDLLHRRANLSRFPATTAAEWDELAREFDVLGYHRSAEATVGMKNQLFAKRSEIE